MDPVVLRNRYRVLSPLGAGGGGSVYLVEELRAAGGTRTKLALKALFARSAEHNLLDSLQLEFRVLATVRHPLIARVHDFGRIPPESGLPGSQGLPGYFFTRDLIEGVDLEHFCEGLSVAEVCEVCRHTAEVLDILHRSGMLHGDLKPANVIVSSDGRPHLIDFGLVRREGQSQMASGTAAYFAPEMLRGEPVDRRADLYALGISLYQLLTSELPRPRASLHELISWHLTGAPLQVSPKREVPGELDEVVLRLTQRDPEQRYPSAGEAALALAEAAAKAGARPTATSPLPFVPPAPGASLSAPLVELQAAATQRTLQRAGGAPLLGIEGDPGAGKSTLLRELAWRCQLAGIEVMRGEYRAGDPRAYGLWSELLAEIAAVVGLPHPLDGSSSTAGDRYAIYQRISEYLAQAAAHVPLLILLDSVEQADEEDRALLRFLAHTLHDDDAVLILAAYRRDERVHRELGAPPRRVLDLLSLADVQRMAADAAGRNVAELAGQIHHYTGGNPLFVMEVLRRLHEAGWPTGPDLQRLAPPQSLEQMCAERWQVLTPSEQTVLHILAVLGRAATGQLLLALCDGVGPASEATLVGLPLERLEDLGWLDRRPDGSYAFCQGPSARFALESCPLERRRQIHLAALEALAQGAGRDVVEWTRHAIGAGRLDLARQSLDQAVAVLRGLGAHRSAIQLLEAASALLAADPLELRRVRCLLGELNYRVGDYEQAAKQLELACADAEGTARHEALIALARVHRSAGRAERALELVHAVEQSEPATRERVAALSEEAAAHLALDAHERVLETVGQALRLLEEQEQQGGPPDIVARAELRSEMAVSLGYLQRHEEAVREFALALADARAGNDHRVEADILNRWAIMASRHADFGEVVERYHAALECARQTGNIEQVAAIQFNLAAFHMQRGEYAECLAHLPESLRLFEAMGALKSLAGARCNMGYIQLKVGLYEQARATLHQALEETRQVGRRSGEALAGLLLALVQARRSHFEEARAGIAAARQLYLELGQRLDAADALLDLAGVELCAGRVEPALSALERVQAEVNLAEVPSLSIRVAELRARVRALDGTEWQRGEALAALQVAHDLAERLHAPELVMQCDAAAVWLCEALGRPEEARARAIAALHTLEQMSASLPPEVRAAFYQDAERRALRERALRVLPPGARPAPTQPPAARARVDTPTSKHLQPATPAADLASEQTIAAASLDATLAPASSSSVLRASEERFYRLLEIYRQINSELDRERLLGLVMDTAVELTGAERGFLLLGQSPAQLQIEVARNLKLEGATGAYSRSIAEQVFSSGEPVISISAHNDPRFNKYFSVHELQLESVLCIPIHARGQTAGVLYMESRFHSGRFTPEDQRLLMAFGDQVALALTNAQLLADNMRKAQQLESAKQEIEALAEERGRLLSQRTQQLEEAQRDLAETRRQLETQVGRFGIVGRSPAMLKLFALVERVAATEVPVLVEGESGTGKEMVARAIHQLSERRKRRLVSVNCAAIPENLLESELFGHVRGAFTGADRERKGLFTAADGGTLFLDEIGDMPARMQVDLLRALQEKTIRPVGAQLDVKVDVRVIAASNKPLLELTRTKAFREDLYYRLNVVTLRLPPLRTRVDDIPLLADHFLAMIATQMKTAKKRLSREALHRLMEYGWPGNVRQLEHTLMNATVLADGEVLEADDLTLEAPASPTSPTSPTAPRAAPSAEPLAQQRQTREKQQILQALEASNWNKTQAATRLGMPRRTFYRRLKEYAIE